MSEVMTRGIIGMPYDLAMGDGLSRRQFHSRAQELLADYAALEAELARLRAGQEPVAYITGQFAGRCVIEAINRAAVLPTGMALYTAPQPSAVPDGWKLVPVEPTPEMISAAEEAHMPFGDMDIALRMAILSAPSAPATVHGAGWIPVSERLPESERTVLAFYLNSHGKGRRVRAEYIAAKTKSADDGWDSDEPADYDEQADEYFWPAGWYEVMDNWDCLTHMVIHEGEVTHWMPLPESPAIAAARQEGKV